MWVGNTSVYWFIEQTNNKYLKAIINNINKIYD
jgi:hypothetical protein